jgi:5'-phosphate synthase pdxT subunit
VRRNAFGRQVDSFESDLAVAGVDGGRVHAVFIRAPVVEAVGDEVEVLATVDGGPVLCREGHVLVAAFHPELGDDLRLHELFLDKVVSLSAAQPQRASGRDASAQPFNEVV